jgi:FAD/FMN-containing dehydrogenase
MGEVGFGVDNIISLRVILASGKIVTVSKSENSDLFWAMRGAGPNFGVVISVTVKSTPATAEDRTAWINNLFFSTDKLVQGLRRLCKISPSRPSKESILSLRALDRR